MSIMKISPFNFNKINKNNNSTRTASPIKPELTHDTVSFKSYGYVDEGLNVVDVIINSDIAPFMADSKELYCNIGKIGYTSQKSLDSYKQNETDFMNYKFNLLEQVNNPLFNKTEKVLKIAQIYKDNVRSYDNLSRMSELESYNTPQIKKEMKELRTLVYSPNKDLNDINRFASGYEDNNELLHSLFDNVTLESKYPAIHKRMRNTQNRHSFAIAFMMCIPYSEATKMLKEKKAIKEETQNTPKDIFVLLKRVDKLQQEAQNIAESSKLYYQNKEKMTKFVGLAKHFELLTPTPEYLQTVYAEMKQSCKEIVKNNRNDFVKEYSNEYEPKLNQIDLKSVEEIIDKQRAKADEIQSRINEIKQAMIEKSNQEVMRKMGFSQDIED